MNGPQDPRVRKAISALAAKVIAGEPLDSSACIDAVISACSLDSPALGIVNALRTMSKHDFDNLKRCVSERFGSQRPDVLTVPSPSVQKLIDSLSTSG